jgi:hypothetical protein
MLPRVAFVVALLLLPCSVFAAPPISVNVVPTVPIPVYVTASDPAKIQTDPVSVFVSNVTLGDIWVLQLVLGLVQCALLGAIHGHQR